MMMAITYLFIKQVLLISFAEYTNDELLT